MKKRTIFIIVQAVVLCLLIGSAPGLCMEDILGRAFPDEVSDKLEKLQIYFETGLYDEAAELLDGLIAQFPDEAGFVYLRGIVDYQRGNYQQASGVFTEFIQDYPYVAKPYYLLTEINLKKGNPEKAKEYLAKYCALMPEDFAAQDKLNTLTAKTMFTDNAKLTSNLADNIEPEGKALFGFEEKVPFWEIPDWCFEKEDYVAEAIALSDKFAKEGKSSLELSANFPGEKWSAVYTEVQEYFDWTPYQNISADVYLPKDVPFGLRAKLILTVGEDWKWTEMSRTVKLVPGEWTTISANVSPGSNDWRRTQVTDEFRADVRKLGIRVESNMRPVYSGPIYIDNVRLN